MPGDPDELSRRPNPVDAAERLRAAWRDAARAARLFALDPAGLGGVAVLAGPGPTRDLWLEGLRKRLLPGTPLRRMPPGIEDDRLLGGVDLPATLKAGRPVMQSGLLAESDLGIVLIPMAERLASGIAARLAGALDRGETIVEREGLTKRVATRIGLVLLDESASADEKPPAPLLDRCAFLIDLRDIGTRGLEAEADDGFDPAEAQTRLAAVGPASEALVKALVTTAAALGIESLRAPLLALRAARASAALAGRNEVATEDAELAARLVLAPRARTLPAVEEEDDPAEAAESPENDENPPASDNSHGGDEDRRPDPPPDAPALEDLLLAAVQAALPEGLLDKLAGNFADRAPASPRHGAGAMVAAPRGRPAGVRAGALRAGSRLALVDTLRAAAPWQSVRRAELGGNPDRQAITVRREDFRVKKFCQRRESTILFCVDASGSTAFQRLAEAKGAVELLLAEAYIARTHAALIVFRGAGAELLLPPTRSLSRAKSLLGTLPGGGGTPLAAGLDLAILAAVAERARGREPLVILLTDGRANIARDGTASRTAAAADALGAARQLGAQRVSAIFIDTSPRPRGDAADIAAAMGARYVALPYVEAAAVRDVVLAAGPHLR